MATWGDGAWWIQESLAIHQRPQVQLDQDEKLGSVQMNTTHSKIGTSEILQPDQAPKETNKQTNILQNFKI